MSGTQPSPANVLNQVVGGLDPGSSASSSFYGLTKSAQAYQFDPSGLTGMLMGVGNGLGNQQSVTGEDLVKAFLAAGQSSDPTVRNTVAAIEYALYAAGSGVYYNKGDRPNLGQVSNVDAQALAKALNDLSSMGPGNVGGNAQGELKPMSVSQFLTSQASLGSANGPNAASAAGGGSGSRTVHVPNPANIAAEYRKVAASLEGENPSEAEVQAFVRQYMSQYVPQQSANRQNDYQAKAAAAGAAQGNPFVPRGADYTGGSLYQPTLPHGLTATDPNTGMSPEQPNPGPADLAQSMDTLTQGSPDAMASLQDVLGAAAGPTYEQHPTNVTVAAENFARNANPNAVHQEELGSQISNFFQILRGIGQ